MTTKGAVVFDIDGTLVDTNYLHAMAWRRAFVDHGFDVPTARVHRMVGAASEVLLDELLPDGGDGDAVKDAWSRHFEALKPEIRPLPGATDLLRAVAGRGLLVLLASSSQPDDVEAIVTPLGADDVISAITHAGDVDQAKPEPDVFTTALEKAGVASDRAVVVGDSPWDVEAARRAGLDTLGVLTGGFTRHDLESAGAVTVYEDAADLLCNLEGSAIARLG